MLFQLTTAGKALLDSQPTTTNVTKVELGSGVGYTLPSNPSGLTGSAVYTTFPTIRPTIIDANTIRYEVFLAKTVGNFQFGEMALWSNSTLLGVGVSSALITKTMTAGGNDGNEIALDAFCDLTPGQRYNTADVDVNSLLTLPTLPLPDYLTPPAVNDRNVYVMYSTAGNQQPYLAIADPTGRWSFTSKPVARYQGHVTTIGDLGMTSSDITGSYGGVAADLVIEFISGAQRGYCRQLSSLSGGTIQWNTPLGLHPAVGDAFIVLGPQDTVASGGGGPEITISGTPAVGNTLTATLTGGKCENFQWYRDGTPISGATNTNGAGTVSTYVVNALDASHDLQVRCVGYTPYANTGVIPGTPPDPIDLRPRFGLGAANAYLSQNAQALLDAMTPIPGSTDNGKAGTFNLQTTPGNYGWVAIVASVSSSGIHFYDGLGYGGWQGAGLAGNNSGASDDPTLSNVTFTDEDGTVWRLFRQDYVNANPSAAPYTIS